MLRPTQCSERSSRPLRRWEFGRPKVLRGDCSCEIPFHRTDVRSQVCFALVRQENRRDKLDLLVSRFVHQVWQFLQAVKVCDDFKCVPLVDQKLLPFGTVKHFLRILGYQRVEEGIEALIISTFCPKNPTLDRFIKSNPRKAEHIAYPVFELPVGAIQSEKIFE
jgi:hypothetical protein